MNKQKPSRGEVWFVQLDPTVGHEQAKTRPCLVISDNRLNHSPAYLHIVLPITSKNKLNNPFRTRLEWLDSTSDIESFILCDQIRSVSRERFTGKILGTVTPETLNVVESIINILLNFNNKLSMNLHK